MFRTLLAASRSARLRPLKPSHHLGAFHQSIVSGIPANTVGIKIANPTSADPALEAESRGRAKKEGGTLTEDEPPKRGRPRQTKRTFEDIIVARKVVAKQRRQRRPKTTGLDAIEAKDVVAKPKRQRKTKIAEGDISKAEDGATKPRRQRRVKTTKGDTTPAQGKTPALKSHSVEREQSPTGPPPIPSKKEKDLNIRQFDPSEDPVIYLKKLFKNEPWTRFDKKRINITSEELCGKLPTSNYYHLTDSPSQMTP